MTVYYSGRLSLLIALNYCQRHIPIRAGDMPLSAYSEVGIKQVVEGDTGEAS